jgi:hypothetical protein
MALFGRRKNDAQGIPGGIPRQFPGGPPSQVPGGFPGQFPGPVGGGSLLAQAAFAQGWQPVGDQPFDGHLEGRVPAITSCLWGMNRSVPKQQNYNTGTRFHDAFRGSIDGRMVTVANASTYLLPPGVRRDPGFGGVGACVVELPSVLPILCVQPRRIHTVLGGMPAVPTGNPEFDQRFIVNAVAALGDARQVLTPEVQQRIMARDDWVFCAERYLLGCFSRGPFGSFDEATQRLSEVLAIVAAIPDSVLPSHVDHSQDDLIDRISRITSVEDALAFLQGLTPGERERLAQSSTPLAAFADCRTPEDAMARFQSLDQGQRMQLIAMFSQVGDARRNP